MNTVAKWKMFIILEADNKIIVMIYITIPAMEKCMNMDNEGKGIKKV